MNQLGYWLSEDLIVAWEEIVVLTSPITDEKVVGIFNNGSGENERILELFQ